MRAKRGKAVAEILKYVKVIGAIVSAYTLTMLVFVALSNWSSSFIMENYALRSIMIAMQHLDDVLTPHSIYKHWWGPGAMREAGRVYLPIWNTET